MFIFLLFRTPVSNAQTNHQDSLWARWQNLEISDSLRCQALKDIIIQRKFYATNLDSALALANRIILLAEKNGSESWHLEGYRLRGLAYYFQGQHETSIAEYKTVAEIARTIGVLKSEAISYHNIAISNRELGNLAEALNFNFKALSIRQKNGNQKGEALSLQSIATVYYNQNKLQETLKYAEEAFSLSKSINYDIGMANAAVSMANAYSDLGRNDEALSYYNEALIHYQNLKRSNHQATCLDNIANIYVKQARFDEAKDFQEQALSIRMKSNNKKGLALSFINVGSTCQKLGEYQKSIEHCKEGLDYAREIKNQRFIFTACECLYTSYKKVNNNEKAFQYYQTYVSAKDSLEGVEKTKLIEEIESRYELKEKESLLTQQELELERERNKRFIVIIIALLLLSIFVLGFLWLRNRLQRRKLAAEQRAKQEQAEAEKLRELDRLKSTFFTNISHEFRTPLTLIMSPLEQMIKGTLKGELSKYHKIMFRNGQRLQGLINQLLDLSKLESGHLKLKMEQGELTSFLNATGYSFMSLADRKQIRYQVTGLDRQIMANFDRDVLEKILMNLISNAFKFTPEEGEINVHFSLKQSTLLIGVSDTGIGIAAKELENIFKRFYSSKIKSDVQMSSGIGLALTKELIDLWKGEINVTSEEGRGSFFKVQLPLSNIKVDRTEDKNEDSVIPTPGISKNELSATNTFQSNKVLVLLVEDNVDVRAYLKEQLSPQFHVAEAENGLSGLEVAKKLQPDLIVSDVMMPKMDGNQMCKALKTDPLTSHIPIILLTAKADQEDKMEGLETGADAYLTKPFDHAELQLRINNLVEQRKKLREKFRSDFRFTPGEMNLTSLDAVFLEDIRQTIDENMDDEHFSVVELSKSIGMSRSNLFRKLKALTNQSPNQVIREMRLIRAKELLENGAGNSAEVAFMVGFNSATYFSKCFRDYFGVQPTKVIST